MIESICGLIIAVLVRVTFGVYSGTHNVLKSLLLPCNIAVIVMLGVVAVLVLLKIFKGIVALKNKIQDRRR